MSKAIIIERGHKSTYNWKGLALDKTSVNGLRFLSDDQRELDKNGICCFIGLEKIISISRNSIYGTKLETWIVTEDK